MPDRALEVVIVDDALAMRRGTELLVREGGFRVVDVASSRAQALDRLRRRRFGVALLADPLAGGPIDELVSELLDERPKAPLLVYAAGGLSDQRLAALTALGVTGIVLSSSAPSVLFRALTMVADGERFVDPALSGRAGVPARGPAPSGVERLSPREREVLRLLGQGLNGAQIADQLFLSTETVRTHVRNAIQKLEARTRIEAVARLAVAEAIAGVRADPEPG